MLLVMLILVCLLVVPLAGGRLSRLADLRIRGALALYAALGVAIAISLVWPHGHPSVHAGLNLGIYGVVLTVLWLNRAIPGVWIVAAGTAANVVAMAANRGIMPATPSALRMAGLSTDPSRFLNSTVVRHPRLPWLGDAFALPFRFPGANVFSVGDVVIVVGGAIALFAVTGASLFRRPRRRPSAAVDVVRALQTVDIREGSAETGPETQDSSIESTR